MTLPSTLYCCEEKNKLNKAVTRFVCSLGMNMHMNGTVMYNGMLPIFMAQVLGVSVGIQGIIALCLTVFIFSLSSAGLPTTGAFFTSQIIYAATVGVTEPFRVLPYMMLMDWFISRIRTLTNITGDAYVAAIVDKLCFGDDESYEIAQYEARMGVKLRAVDPTTTL